MFSCFHVASVQCRRCRPSAAFTLPTGLARQANGVDGLQAFVCPPSTDEILYVSSLCRLYGLTTYIPLNRALHYAHIYCCRSCSHLPPSFSDLFSPPSRLFFASATLPHQPALEISAWQCDVLRPWLFGRQKELFCTYHPVSCMFSL